MRAWQIRLAPSWQRFARPEPGTEFLGTAQQQAQIGALGLRDDGQFVLVNGAHVTELNGYQIARALRKTPGGASVVERHTTLRRRAAMAAAAPVEAEPAAPPRAPATTPVVIVKKRRRLIEAFGVKAHAAEPR